MTLGEKIQYYRKQSKLSQEELAARVGVSRQAVSKWELGEATPEVDKLVALAKAFGVTTDELLSSEEPEAETPPLPPPPPEPPYYSRRGLWGLEGLIRRYGWLAGVYIALSGAGITLVGGLARYAFYKMFQITVGDRFNSMGWDVSLPSEFDGYMGLSTGMISPAGTVFSTMATVILVIGVVTMIAGAALAVYLYRKGRKGD